MIFSYIAGIKKFSFKTDCVDGSFINGVKNFFCLVSY